MSSSLSAQRYANGRIVDISDGLPVPGVVVFFDNTTVGTITDVDGNYMLGVPGEGSYRLTFLHVGYQTVFIDIEPGNTNMVFDIALQTNQLEELTISASVRFRRSDVNLFWRTILGANPSRRTIQALNPEAVFYYYNQETRILRVTCRAPIQIVNHETGYHVQYLLDYFTHDYNTGFTDWSYQAIFSESEPQNIRQKNRWEEKRTELYNVSITKFIKSLYNNTLLNDGFLLADYQQNADPDNPFELSLLNRDEILYTNPITNSKTLDLADRRVLLFCYGRSVTAEDLIDLDRELSQYSERRLDRHGLIRNMLRGSIDIFPDGTFTNSLSVSRVNNSASLVGLNMILPIDYSLESSIQGVIADNTRDFESVAQLFDRQLSVFPQEKIHLHSDRDFYVPGERIWFKAYLTDALSHQSTTSSRYVYVELISPADTLISRVMIRPDENNMYHGHILISEIIPEGNYTLRAYTQYMENLGNDYFFKKNIRIGNLASAKAQSAETDNRISETDDFDVSFFPEGGNLLDGALCRVAFKALNSSGHSEVITGEIVDENGLTIASVQTFHAGMGVFGFIPEHGKRYFLKCRNASGLEKQFELPQSESRAYALTISQRNNRISAGIRKSAQVSETPLYLLAHCRGEVFHFDVWNSTEEFIAFSEENMPSGVIHFVLFDDDMNPLSERLAFNKNHFDALIDFKTDKTEFEMREKVVAAISVNDSDGNILNGHLSVAITDDSDISVDTSTTIFSSLLLSSELKGYIENPAWYLNDDIKSITALDLLMMTHGWRRYNIPEVVRGKMEEPQIAHQNWQQISGYVKNQVRSMPVANSEVLIMVEDGDFGQTTTDESGIFNFNGFEYPDSTSFFLQVLTNRGSDRLELVLDGEPFPELIYAPQSPVWEIQITEHQTDEDETDPFIEKAELRSRFDEEMWSLNLSELTITGRRIEPIRRSWANTGAHVSVQREEIEEHNFYHAAEYLMLIPGIQVFVDPGSGGATIIVNSGPTSFVAGGGPLILIDGVPDENWFLLRPEEIENISVFKHASASSFGTRGANGVINITTRVAGGDVSNNSEMINSTVHTPLGYQKPIEFYSPKYETLEAKRSVIPDYRTTIFWKPDIVISEEGEASFEFYTADFPTTYSVVIEGLTDDGRIVRQVEKIRVK